MFVQVKVNFAQTSFNLTSVKEHYKIFEPTGPFGDVEIFARCR